MVLLKYVGMNPVVVHGGGPDITSYMERLGMEVRFVEGLRVSDEATVEVAKMVLVGKQNKDIVLRINRHGQPAVGPVRRRRPPLHRAQAARGGRHGHRVRGPDRARRRGRAASHRRGLHPGHRVGRRRHGGQLLQRQRRRRGGRRGRGARGLQDHLPDRCRGLARRARRPVDTDLGGHRGRAARAAPAPSAAACARSSRPACTRSTAGVGQRAHRRRPPAALAAARAVHGRGHRDQAVAPERSSRSSSATP